MDNKGYYKFTIGSLECVCLSDGGYNYPPQNFLTNITLEEASNLLRSKNLPTDYIWTPYTYLFVDTKEQKILIDLGAGKLAETTGIMLGNMKKAGIKPEEITAAFITHAHPDHIGGMLDEAGELVFYNAEYYIWKEEWNFWFSEEATNNYDKFASFARAHLNPIKDRIHFISDEKDIFPGIHVLSAPGHTPGHMAVSISSEGVELIYTGDTVLYPLLLEYKEILSKYDILPDQAAKSKQRIFDYAAKSNAWIVGQHFPPFPSLGHIKKLDNGWQWEPINID